MASTANLEVAIHYPFMYQIDRHEPGLSIMFCSVQQSELKPRNKLSAVRGGWLVGCGVDYKYIANSAELAETELGNN